MKILGIGDIHGRTIWEKIVDQDFDQVVFIGDYLDSRDEIDPVDQIDNLKRIIDFKINNPSKVKLLIGNHDYHYLRGINESYTGYQPSIQYDVEQLFIDHMKLFQICYIYDKYAFTHAGITKTWYNTSKKYLLNRGIDIGEVEVDEIINLIFEYRPSLFGFTLGGNQDNYGNDITQTPIWVRPESLIVDRLGDYFHVVGHTFGEPEIIEDSDPGGVIKIDCLGLNQYLEINIKKDMTNDNIIFKKIDRCGPKQF